MPRLLSHKGAGSVRSRFVNILKAVVPFLFILFLAGRFFYPVLLEGRTFYAFDNLYTTLPWSASNPGIKAHNPLITDPINIYYPHYKFVADFFEPKDMSFKFWNGSIFCGKPNPPFGGNPIEFFAYWLFSPSVAHDLVLFIHLLATGLFMYLYLRSIDLRVLSSLVGALAWMFNGHLMVWFEFQNMILGAPALPASFLCIELWIKKKREFAPFLVCAFSFTITSGYAPVVFFHSILLVAYFLYRLFTLPKGEKRGFTRGGIRSSLHLALGAVLLLCIAATFLTSHRAFIDNSHRKEYRFSEIYDRTGQLPKEYLLTLLFPDFFGSPAGGGPCFTPGAKPYNNYNELCIYSGVFSLFLAFSCIPFLGRRKYVLFFLGGALIALLMAMGSVLYYPLFRFLPGLNLSTPTRVLYVFCFSLTVMSALGADIVLRETGRRRWTIVPIWILLLLSAIIASWSVQTDSGIRWVGAVSGLDLSQPQEYKGLVDHFHIAGPAVLGPLLFAGISFITLLLAAVSRDERGKNKYLCLGLLVLAYDLLFFGLRYNSVSPREMEYPKTGAIRFLEQDPNLFRVMSLGNFMHNGFAPFGIQDIGGYSSFYPKRYAEYVHLSQHGPGTPFPETHSRWVNFHRLGSPLLDVINMKYVFVPSQLSIQSSFMELVYDQEVRIYENKDVLPRAFIVPSYSLCNSQETAYAALGSFTVEDFRQKVILESEPPLVFSGRGEEQKEGRFNVTEIRYGRDKIDIRVSCPSGGFLVLSDNYHKSWKAKVDGSEKPVLRANYTMMSIPLEAGSQNVEIRFHDVVLLLGPIITASGWISLGVWICFWFRKRRKESR